MNKVKVTKEQAEWLEKYKTEQEIDYAINIQPYKKRPDSPIVDWKPSEVAKALWNGYEVEERFKLGDVAYHKRTGVMRMLSTQQDVNFVNNEYVERENMRLATEDEIKWFKMDRRYCELKNGDKYITTFDSSRTIEGDFSKGLFIEAYNSGEVEKFYPVESSVNFK